MSRSSKSSSSSVSSGGSGGSTRNHYGHVGCKDYVWAQADKIRGKNPDLYRRDAMGNTLYYPNHGKYSEMGWHIDHIKPQAAGGTDSPRNLQVLQAAANIKKSDQWPGHVRH